VAVLVEGQVAHDENGVLVIGGDDRGPAHERSEPRDDLLEAERLGHVVVAAGGEARDAVLDGVPRGEEQDRNPLVVLPHAAEHLHAVHVGQHHVEGHGVRLELSGGADGGHTGPGRLDLPALVAQRHAEQLGEVVLVVDDEHPRRSAVGTHELLSASGERVHVLTVIPLPWRAVCRCYAVPVDVLWWEGSRARRAPAQRYLCHRFVTVSTPRLSA
jgi:hypothetical protein